MLCIVTLRGKDKKQYRDDDQATANTQQTSCKTGACTGQDVCENLE